QSSPSKGCPHRAPMSQTPLTTTHTLVVPSSVDMVSVLGPADVHLDLVEDLFDVAVHVRGNRISISGEIHQVAAVEKALSEVVTIVRSGHGITPETVERIIAMVKAEDDARPADVLGHHILS